MPFTKIEELEPPASAKILLDKLGNYDAVIFTSQSAVKYGIKFVQEKCANVNHIPIISIGLATQSCLNELGISSDVPKTYTSEGISKLIIKKDYRKYLQSLLINLFDHQKHSLKPPSINLTANLIM